jgi:hypothetical protein
MTVSVQITDPTKAKFGFELTARLASNASQGQAGDFTTGADGFTQVLCDDSSTKTNGSPCPAQFPVQFIEHTLKGFNASTQGSFTYTFTWTPPESGAGNVILYAAANAGPAGSPVQSPTNVYTTNVTLTPGAAPAQPTITPNGVVPLFSTSTTLQPGSWISIYGTNFAAAPAFWNGDFPTLLSGVSVSIDSKPAYIWFVSPRRSTCRSRMTSRAVPSTWSSPLQPEAPAPPPCSLPSVRPSASSTAHTPPASSSRPTAQAPTEAALTIFSDPLAPSRSTRVP